MNKTKTLVTWQLVLLGLAACLSTSLPSAFASVSSAIFPEDGHRMAIMRQAGLKGNRSQIPALIAALQKPPVEYYERVTLHALAQLGATEALPAFNKIITRTQMPGDVDPELNNFARVAKARLLAESAARAHATSTAQAIAKISRFYAELGLTPANLNASVSFSHTSIPGWDAADIHPPLSIPVYAMREVADMAYRGSYSDYASLPDVAQVNFALDAPSALKMRMAALSQIERVNIMVEHLSHKKVLTKDDNFEIQLLADEGLTASRAAAAKIRDMGEHRSDYPINGFDALCQVLVNVGDGDQLTLAEQFKNDPSDNIKASAKFLYDRLESGFKRAYADGY